MLENKATLDDLEHCSGLHGIGVLLSKILGELCASDRIEKLWVQHFKLVSIIRIVLIERHGEKNIQMHSGLLMIPYPYPALCIDYSRSGVHQCKRRSTSQTL